VGEYFWRRLLTQTYDDLVQSPCRLGRLPENASITTGKTTKLASHDFVGVKLDATVVVGLEVQGFHISSGLHYLLLVDVHYKKKIKIINGENPSKTPKISQ